MNFNADFNADAKNNINTIQSLVTNIDKQINDLTFTKDCIIDKLVAEIKSIYTLPFAYNEKFYATIIAYLNRKENPLPKTKEERKEKFGYEPKDCYEILLEDIQNIFPSVTKINKILWYGFNSHGVDVYFDIDANTYYLYIPIIKNISRNDVIWDSGYIDYDIAKFQLFKQTGKSSWTRIYNSYDLNKELIEYALK
jgi:hypothetical protein